MGNPASRLGCLGERRNRSRTGPRIRGDASPSIAPQDPLPPGIPWAWWCSHAVQVTEVTETVVTETVVTEAVEVGPCEQGGKPAQAPPAVLDSLCSWLDGMEELQASQGPLAADAALAASQLREQELLLRLLRERAPHVEPRLQEAGSPAELCTQWHRLVQQAEARWGLLEQLVPAARRFERACKALLVQLRPGYLEGSLQYLQCTCEGTAARARAEDLEEVLETGQKLAELLTEDQAQLVQQQLGQFQERVRLTESQVACAQQKLLYAPRTGPPKPSTPAGLEAQLDQEESVSAHLGLKDQKQLSIQLAQLAGQIEQLAPRADTPSQAAAPIVTIWKQSLSSAVPQAEVKSLEVHWSEAQEQDTGLKSTWESTEWIWCGLAEHVAIHEELWPEGNWNPALQEFLWGQQTLAISWLRRAPVLKGETAYGGTCHLGLLMDLLSCQAAMSIPSRERMLTLEERLPLADHLVEKLLTCPHRVSQAEPLGIKVVQAQGWVLEELPRALRAAGLKHWTPALGEALALRGPDQSQPGDLGGKAKACLLGKTSEELGWRPGWAEATMESQRHRKSENSRKNWEDKNQWVQMEQGHLEQDLTDSFLAAGEQERDGQGWPSCTWGTCGPAHKFPAMLGSWLTNGQQQPHSMARARAMEGTSAPGARGRSKVQGASAARGSLMVRVGGGWAALDEFLVKNDPGRAKGRTSQKIHERFLCWAPSGPAPEVITLRLWASIRMASNRPRSQKTGLPTGKERRHPSSYKVKASEPPTEEQPR
uniref:cDNA sequence BC024139 n=2 Tax=Nannospalax galili TaxID=1026970 RepID=A0A8C6RHA3_NANGA